MPHHKWWAQDKKGQKCPATAENKGQKRPLCVLRKCVSKLTHTTSTFESCVAQRSDRVSVVSVSYEALDWSELGISHLGFSIFLGVDPKTTLLGTVALYCWPSINANIHGPTVFKVVPLRLCNALVLACPDLANIANTWMWMCEMVYNMKGWNK